MKGINQLKIFFLILVMMMTSMPQMTYASDDAQLESQEIVVNNDFGNDSKDYFAEELSTEGPAAKDETVAERVYELPQKSLIVDQPVIFRDDFFEANFTILEESEDTFIGEIILENTSLVSFKDWELEFNLNQEIIHIENAEIVRCRYNQYTISGVDSTAYFYAGERIRIIFEAKLDGNFEFPDYFSLDGEIDFDHYPEDETEYKIWKEQVLARKNNNVSSRSFRLQAASEAKKGSIGNDYIRFTYVNGPHGVMTTGGDPDNPYDDYRDLLYGSGLSSLATIRIDGENYDFENLDSVTTFENKMIGTKQIGDIIVYQQLSIVYNPYTQREDTVEFLYTVKNTGDTPHTVGVRLLLDTVFDGNDLVPFKIPGIGERAIETELWGDDIPEYWQIFNSVTNPKIIAQGILKVDKEYMPDRVRFTNWTSARLNMWDYYVPEGQSNGDSAVALYWNERTLGKDASFSCKTFFGLGKLEQDLTPPLSLAVMGTTELGVLKNEAGEEEYSPNPMTISAFIENIGTGTATNVIATLNLPEGMEIVEGSQSMYLGDLPAGAKKYDLLWKVKVQPTWSEKVAKYSVTITADNTDSKTVEKEIVIPKFTKVGGQGITFTHIKDTDYKITLKTKNRIDKAVIQFKNPNGWNWALFDDIKDDDRFIMIPVENYGNPELFTYEKIIRLTTTGRREFRILFLNSKNEIIEKSDSQYINAGKLVSFDTDRTDYKLIIKKHSEVVNKIKVCIGKQFDNIGVSNTGINTEILYFIDSRNFAAGTYDLYLMSYDVNGNLLEITPKEKLNIENPFNVIRVTPQKIKVSYIKGNSYINIVGNGFSDATRVKIIDGNKEEEITPKVISHNYMRIPIPNLIKNTTDDKTVIIRATDGMNQADIKIEVTGK